MKHEFEYGSDKVSITALGINPRLEYLRELKPASFKRVA